MPVLGLYCEREALAEEIGNTILMLAARCRTAERKDGMSYRADYELYRLPLLPGEAGAETGGAPEMLSALLLSCEAAGTAFEAAERLWEQLPVIFIAEKAEEVFAALAHPFFHVVRAYALEQDLQAALRKIEKSRPPAPKWQTFQGRNGLIRVKQKDILYLESERHEIRVHGKKEIFITSETLTQCEEKLKKAGFVRIHKSYLVNLYHVERMEKDSLLLEGGERLFISRYRYPEVKSRFETYIRRLDFI